uniref:Uncharacterized protein n=1 Tax=Panagrellus redivivus TaxID=6233 RepID=A0A7E4V330_PANRE
MSFYKATVIVTCIFISVQTVEVGREVEGGFEVLNTGPIQLIVPDVLSFTIRNEAQCKGLFRICYLSVPNASRRELERRGFWNMGTNCPIGYCTLSLEPEHDVVFGLSAEWHDGNLYGMLVEGTGTMCSRYVANYVSNFTIIDVPKCSVIIDAARLPEKKTVEKPKDKTFKVKLIIAICIGLALLLLIAGIVGLYFCTRFKKEAVPPVKFVRHTVNPSTPHKTSPINKQLESKAHVSVSRSAKTSPSYKQRDASKEPRQWNSQKANMKSDNLSNSATSNEV